jgi:cobalt-zinc-cadmium efflux system outer membrane protein
MRDEGGQSLARLAVWVIWDNEMPERRPLRWLGTVAVCLLVAGCASTPRPCDVPALSAKVADRTGFAFGRAPGGPVVLPNGACIEDGLIEDEAILIALWNNAQFQESLNDLGVARGDLVQARLLPNPELLFYFASIDKPFRYLVDMPIEAFWLRPIRVRAAGREAQRVCQRLAQLGLDLIRDTRVAYADALVAQGRLEVAQAAVRVRGEIARLAAARLKAGDISAQEATTARIDADLAEQDLVRINYDVAQAHERLRWVMGIGDIRAPLHLDDSVPPVLDDLDAEALTADAVATRPDALAAEQNTIAARERLRLSRLVWFRFLGIADATAGFITDHELGPGMRVTLPIFNWNQGNVQRFSAEFERADRNRRTVHNQIVLDVHQAHYRYSQAKFELDILDGKTGPEAEAAIRRAEQAYREGNTPYVIVLETTRQLLDTRLRRYVLHAELRRAWAELERSVGHHLDAPIVATPKPPAPAPLELLPAPKEAKP